jgi:hypothetical protein
LFVASWADDDSFFQHGNAAAPPKFAKELDVFHESDLGKSAQVFKDIAPTEHAVIAAAHSQRQPRVMPETVRQSIDGIFSRQPDAEETAYYLSILQCLFDFVRRAGRNFSINMEKPENVAASDSCAGAHLHGAIGGSRYELIAKSGGKIGRPVGAAPIDHDDFRSCCALAKVREKISNEQRFIKDGNNDRNLHAQILRL